MRDKQIEDLKDYKYGFSTDIESFKAPKGFLAWSLSRVGGHVKNPLVQRVRA